LKIEVEKYEAKMAFAYSKSERRLHVTLDCPKQSIDELTDRIQQKVASSVREEDRFRMMYDFASKNLEYSRFEKKAVYLGEPPLFVRKRWLSIVDLPTKGKAGLRLAGHQGSGVKSITEATNCAIIVVHDGTDHPHVCIIGDCATAVNECRKLVKERLEKCR
jgi:hypothetical protein